MQEQRQAVEGEASVPGNRREHVGVNLGRGSAELQIVRSLGPIDVITAGESCLRELPWTRCGRAQAGNSTGNCKCAVGQTFVWKPLQLRMRDDVAPAALPGARDRKSRLAQQGIRKTALLFEREELIVVGVVGGPQIRNRSAGRLEQIRDIADVPDK